MALPVAYRIRITAPIPAWRDSDVAMVDVIMARDFALHTRAWTEITLSEIDEALRRHWPEQHIHYWLPRDGIDAIETMLNLPNTCYQIEGRYEADGSWRRLQPEFSEQPEPPIRKPPGRRRIADDPVAQQLYAQGEAIRLREPRLTRALIANQLGLSPSMYKRYISAFSRAKPGP